MVREGDRRCSAVTEEADQQYRSINEGGCFPKGNARLLIESVTGTVGDGTDRKDPASF